MSALGRLVYLFNSRIRKQHGYAAAERAVASGFLMLFPFTALALIAELYFGWNAVQAFSSAGIMTAGAAAGMEVGKLGGNRLASMLVPSLGALALSGVWMVLSALALSLWKG